MVSSLKTPITGEAGGGRRGVYGLGGGGTVVQCTWPRKKCCSGKIVSIFHQTRMGSSSLLAVRVPSEVIQVNNGGKYFSCGHDFLTGLLQYAKCNVCESH